MAFRSEVGRQRGLRVSEAGGLCSNCLYRTSCRGCVCTRPVQAHCHLPGKGTALSLLSSLGLQLSWYPKPSVEFITNVFQEKTLRVRNKAMAVRREQISVVFSRWKSGNDGNGRYLWPVRPPPSVFENSLQASFPLKNLLPSD